MPRAVFFGFPARGHTVPSLPLVRALVDRGIEVDYHSTAAFAGLIAGAGARFVEYPPGCEPLSRRVDLGGLLLGVVNGTARILPELVDSIQAPPDLVLADGSAWWGRLLAARWGVPSVTSITTFALTRAMLELLGVRSAVGDERWRECSDALASLSRDQGVPVHDPLDVLAHGGDLKVVYTSRQLQPAGHFLDASHLFVGPLLAGRPREGARVIPSSSRPLAFVSLGTGSQRQRDLLRVLSGTLSSAGWEVVVSLGEYGGQGEGAVEADWPPHVQAHPFVDQIGLLSQARLMVTHGGLNSVTEALALGVPLVIVPQAVDQYLVARRVAELGAAVVIGDFAGLEAAVARIERERAGFDAAAARIARSFEEVPPLSHALDRIEGLLVAGRRP